MVMLPFTQQDGKVSPRLCAGGEALPVCFFAEEAQKEQQTFHD